jgi:hypothetical protein
VLRRDLFHRVDIILGFFSTGMKGMNGNTVGTALTW